MLTKHQLPPYAVLPHVHVDVERLRAFLGGVQDRFADVIQANQGLCGIHHRLVESVYDCFSQISLTTLPPTLAEQGRRASETECREIEGMVAGGEAGSLAARVRRRKRLAGEASVLNEHSYDFRTELLRGSYVEELLGQFRARATRVRLVKLAANSSVPPHIDYDPSYAVRVIVPLVADDFCVNSFWVKNELHATVFRPGRAYFLNTGYRHAVMNHSSRDRVTLMLSLQGQDDLRELC